MTIREWIIQLTVLSPEEQASCWFLLQAITNRSRSDLLLSINQTLDDEQLVRLELGKKKMLEEHYPPQYFVGHAYFYGRKFAVDKRVLIPRFDTEVVVEAMIQELHHHSAPHILDIGTGSGAIAITLALELPHATLTATDISRDTLVVARQNARELNASVTFIESDLFTDVEGWYDAIITNPPYIDPDEEVMEMVKSYEPHLALYSSNHGLYHNQMIIQEAKNHLTPNGVLVLELHSAHSQEAEQIASTHFCEVEIKRDLCGLDRVLIARRPR